MKRWKENALHGQQSRMTAGNLAIEIESDADEQIASMKLVVLLKGLPST